VAVLLAVATVLFVRSAVASPILVNGSFELGPPLGGAHDVDVAAGSTGLAGWLVTGSGSSAIDYLGVPWGVADGLHAVDPAGTRWGAASNRCSRRLLATPTRSCLSCLGTPAMGQGVLDCRPSNRCGRPSAAYRMTTRLIHPDRR